MFYLDYLLQAQRLADKHRLPHNGLTFIEPPLKTVDLKRCVVAAQQAVKEMEPPASPDPRRTCIPVCLVVSEALERAGYRHEITYGNVLKDGKPLLSNVSARSMLDKFQSASSPRPNFYCWLTLNDGSIVDFTVQGRSGGQVDTEKMAKSFLYLPPGEKDKRYHFEPMLVGNREFLQRIDQAGR